MLTNYAEEYYLMALIPLSTQALDMNGIKFYFILFTHMHLESHSSHNTIFICIHIH